MQNVHPLSKSRSLDNTNQISINIFRFFYNLNSFFSFFIFFICVIKSYFVKIQEQTNSWHTWHLQPQHERCQLIKAHMSSGEIIGEHFQSLEYLVQKCGTFSNFVAQLSVIKAQNSNSKYKINTNNMLNILHYYYHHHHHQLIQD